MFRKLLFQTWWRLAVSAILPFLFIGGTFILKKGWQYHHFITLEETFTFWIASSVPIFFVLTSISLYVREEMVGWKRLSLVVASGLGLVSFVITLMSWSSLRGDDAAIALLLSCAAFPFGVLLILGGRSTTQWVRAGFSDPATSVMRPSVDRESNLSHAREAVTPQIENTSTDANVSISDRDKIIATPLAGPWRRFWARSIDIWLLGFPVTFGLAIALINFDSAWGSWLQKSSSNYTFSWFSFPVVLLAEAMVFGIFGNTPGKMLLSLRVTTVGGTKLSFNDYLSRLLGVYWYGLGTGFPIVSLFTMIKQYQHLKLGRETRYDSGRFSVRGHPLGWFRIALAVVVVFLLLVMVPGMLTELPRRA